MNGRELCKINDNLKNARSNWDSMWQDIADNIVYRKSSITGTSMPGAKRTQRMYDSTATMAAQDLAAWISGNLTSGEWFRLKFGDDNDVKEYQEWLEECRRRQHKAFRGSNWSSEWNEVLLDLVQFCTGAIHVEENEVEAPGFNGFNFISMPPGTYCVMLGRDRRAKGIFRELQIKASEAIDRWGNKVSDEIEKSAIKDPGKLHDFLHACFPVEWFGGKHRIKSKPYVSYYIDVKKKTIMQEGGYYWFPFFVIPYLRESGEDYGRGPGWTALPEVKTAHKEAELDLKSKALNMLPPLTMIDNGVIGSVRLTPGGLTVVAKTGGHDNLKPLLTGARVSDNRAIRDEQRQIIREIFHSDKVKYIQPRDQTGQMTAHEVERRYQLAQILLGPTFGNIVDHGFDPIVEATFQMMYVAGVFPDPPGGLKQILGQPGGDVGVEYESPLARAARVQELDAITQTLEGAMALMEAKPDIMDNFKLDDASVFVAKARGYPAKLISSDDERSDIRDGRAELQGKQDELEKLRLLAAAAKDGAGAAKDMSPEMMNQLAGKGE